MSYILTSDTFGPVKVQKFSDAQWDGVVELAKEFNCDIGHLRGLPHGSNTIPVDIPPILARQLRGALGRALRAGKPYPPGGDPVDADIGTLTREVVHRVTHILRMGGVQLQRAPAWHMGEEGPDVLQSSDIDGPEEELEE